MIEEAVAAVGEIQENTGVGEHGGNGFATFNNIDMFLHINFHQFGAFHQRNLFHQFHLREGEIGYFVQDGIIYFDDGIRVVAQQRTQLNTAVFITADIVGKAFFHFHKPFDFIKCPEGGNFAVITQFIDKFITVFAVFQQVGGYFYCALGGCHLEIEPHCIQHQILFCTAGALFTQQQTVMSLLGVEKCQTEIQHTESKVDIQVIQAAILALRIGISTGSGTVKLTAFGGGYIISGTVIIRNIQFRQHSEHFAGFELLGNLFFKTHDFEVEVVFDCKADALIQR